MRVKLYWAKMQHPKSEPEDNSNEEVFYSMSSAVSDATLSASDPTQSPSTSIFQEALSLPHPPTVTKSRGIKLRFKPRKLIPRRLRPNQSDASTETTPDSSQPFIATEKQKSPSDSAIKKKTKRPSMMKKLGFGKRGKVAPRSMDEGTTSSSTTPGSVKRHTPEGATLSISDQSFVEVDKAFETGTMRKMSKLSRFYESERGDMKKKSNKASSIGLQSSTAADTYKLDQPNNTEDTDQLPATPPTPYTRIVLKNKPISSEANEEQQLYRIPASISSGEKSEELSQYNSIVAAIKNETAKLNVSKSNSDIPPTIRAPAVPYNISELEIAHILEINSLQIFNELPKEVPHFPFASIESTDSDQTQLSPSEYSEYIKRDRKATEASKEIDIFTVGAISTEFMKRGESKKLETIDGNKKSKLSIREKKSTFPKTEALIPTVHVQKPQSKSPYISKEIPGTSFNQQTDESLKEEINFRIGTPVRPVKTISSITDSISLEDGDQILHQKTPDFSSSESQSPSLSEGSLRKIKYEPIVSVEEQVLLEPGSFGSPNSFVSDYSIDYSLNPLSMTSGTIDRDLTVRKSLCKVFPSKIFQKYSQKYPLTYQLHGYWNIAL